MKTLIKDLLREIRLTKNRFISILLITLLGVCFFVGLRVIGPQMEYTANKYFEDTNLYDISFMSTYGFSNKDIEAIKNDKDTKDIFATYSTDLLLGHNDKSIVAKAYGMPNKEDIVMMDYELISGSYPKESNECVISDNYLKANNLKLGDTLKVEDYDSVKIKEKELKIVGTASWSYYITDDDYGSSKLGDGTINTFLILSMDAFDSDYYTDLYVSLKSTKDINCFSEEYEQIITDYKDRIKETTSLRETQRLQEEKDKAYKEIEDSQKELDEKKKDAYNELSSAEEKLKDSTSKLSDSKNELESQKSTLKNEIANAKAKLNKSEKELETKEKQINSAKAELKTEKEELEKQEEEFYNYVASLTEEEKEALKDILSKQEQELKDAKTELETKEKELSIAQTQITNAKKEIKSGYSEIEKQENTANKEFANASYQITSAQKEIDSGYSEYNKNKEKADEEFANAQKKIDDAKAEVEDMEEVKWYTLDRNTNESYFSYAENSKKITSVAKVFPLIFFLVAALVCLTTMTRMVEEKRTELGILKALGFGKFAVSMKFIVYAFLASFIGSIIGLIIGFTFVPNMIYEAYRILYKTPELIPVIYPNYIVISLVVGVMCTVLSAYVACNSDLREVAASLLRPKVMKSGRKALLERIPFIWNKLSFKWKITIRNLMRYKKRLIMSVVGIGACCGLLIAGFGLRYSVSSMIDLQYTHVRNYNMETSLDSDVSTKEIKEIEQEFNSNSEIKESKLFYQDTYEVEGDKKSYNFSLMVPIDTDAMNNYIYLTDYETEQSLTLPDNGIIITSRLSEIAGIKKGDTIKIKDMDGKEYQVSVAGVVNNYIYHYAFISKDYYEQLTNEDVNANLILSRLTNNDEETYDNLSKEILKNKNILSVEFNQRMADGFSQQLDSLDFVIVVIIIAAGMLAFIVMFNLDNINVSERFREIATIKVLGFYNNEVNLYIVRENIILNIIGIIVGCLIGKFFHQYLMNTVAVDFVQFYNDILISSYIYGVVLTIVFAVIVNIFLNRTLKKINMVESLKSVE